MRVLTHTRLFLTQPDAVEHACDPHLNVEKLLGDQAANYGIMFEWVTVADAYAHIQRFAEV